MPACFLRLATFALCVGAVWAATPISKVIDLLTEMQKQGTAAKKAEETKFSAFSQWCGDQARIKGEEIKAATEQMALLSAKIEQAGVHIKKYSDRIQELDDDVDRWATDAKATSDVRSKEAADFQATQADYSESLDALDGAIAVLKKQATQTQQASFAQVRTALLQVSQLKTVPLASKRALTVFLQQGQPDVEEMPDKQLFYSAPEAYGYEFQSGGVVDILEKLKDTFSSKKYDLEHEELTAKHSFEQLAQLLTDNTENAKHEIAKKTELRAETQRVKAETEGDLAQTTADRAEDQKYLDETTALCQSKSNDFESRQKLRAEELEAIAKVLEIMSSETVSGAGDKHLPSFLQSRQANSLAQLRGDGDSKSPLQARISAFLADRARTCDSRLLAMISQRVASDPFTKVKRMIKDLISKLMNEATSETEHKGWCDAELVENKITRESKTEQVDKLQGDVESLTALIAQLAQELADLSAGVRELSAAMASATADRAASKEKNDQAIKDAKGAQTALQEALAIMKDFYAKSVKATALVQQTPADDAPETFDKAYKGMFPEGGNIVDFLEVILSDFARLESETTSSEATELDEYKRYMFESEKDKALKENDIRHKESRKSDSESALRAANDELKATQAQLDKAVEYYEKLKPTCVDSGITYEERVKRREEEIQSLQEALKILTGTDVDLS